jgi:hypothetical protein
MMKAKIKLAFRIVIDQNSEIIWDKYIFEDTFLSIKFSIRFLMIKKIR